MSSEAGLVTEEPAPQKVWSQRAGVRFGLCSLAGLVAAALAPHSFWVRGLLGWNVASTLLLLVYLWIILNSNAELSRKRAGSADPGRTLVWVMLLLACLFSLGASLVMMGDAQESKSLHPHLLVIFCLWAILSAWFLTHTSFTLRYAHLYYRDEGNIGGLNFPGDDQPDDMDFAYFSFTLGMCFQVSDVAIAERSIRRTALLHAILSFFYNTAILALSLNLIFGHLGTLKLN